MLFQTGKAGSYPNRGKSIETVEIGGATSANLAEMMVGRSVSFKTEKVAMRKMSVSLAFSCKRNREVIPAVTRNFCLSVSCWYEVSAGLRGPRRKWSICELIQAITGLRKVKSGSVRVKARTLWDFMIHVKSQK